MRGPEDIPMKEKQTGNGLIKGLKTDESSD